MKKRVFASAAALVVLFLAGCSLQGTSTATALTTAVIIRAADRLVETQNSDGGWDWQNPDTDRSTGTPSPPNTLGVTAQGVLDAYKVTGSSGYLAAAMKAYGALVTNSKSTDVYISRSGDSISCSLYGFPR